MLPQRLYVVEHLEEELGGWCLTEYNHIKEELKSQSIITNFDPQKVKYTEEVDKSMIKFNYSEMSVSDCIQQNQYLPSQCCVLDMNAPIQITPQDIDHFSYFIFGGILGDVPPRKRTSKLDKLGVQKRNLGTFQMPTNHAVLTCFKIIEQQTTLENIEFVDNPEFENAQEEGVKSSVVMEGFRYLAKEGKPLYCENFLQYIFKTEIEEGFFQHYQLSSNYFMFYTQFFIIFNSVFYPNLTTFLQVVNPLKSSLKFTFIFHYDN